MFLSLTQAGNENAVAYNALQITLELVLIIAFATCY